MKKSFIGITVLAIVTLACSTLMPAANNAEPTVAEPGVGATNAPSQDTASRLEGLGSYPCPDSDFICVKLPVPLNHFDPSDSRMIDVVFGVLPATGERKGMFVTSIGGPGGSGLDPAARASPAQIVTPPRWTQPFPSSMTSCSSTSVAWGNREIYNA